jgi:hypothetical protein
MLILDKARALAMMVALAERRPVPPHLTVTGTPPRPDYAAGRGGGLTDLLALARYRRGDTDTVAAEPSRQPGQRFAGHPVHSPIAA